MDGASQFSSPERRGEAVARVVCRNPQDFVEAHERLAGKLEGLDRILVELDQAAEGLPVSAKRLEAPLGKLRIVQVLLANEEESKRNIDLTPSMLAVVPTLTKFSQACALVTRGQIGSALELGLVRSVFYEAKRNNLPALEAAAKVTMENEVVAVRTPTETFKNLADEFLRNLREIEQEYRIYLGGKPKPSSALLKSAIIPIDRQFGQVVQLTNLENVRLDCWQGLSISSQAMELSRDIGALAVHVDAFKIARTNVASLISEELEKESRRINKRQDDTPAASLESVPMAGSSSSVPVAGSRLDRALQFAKNAINTFGASDTMDAVASQARAELLWKGLGPSGQRDITKHLARLRSDGHLDQEGECLALNLIKLFTEQDRNNQVANESAIGEDQELLYLALEEIGLSAEDLAVIGRVSIDQIERVSNTARNLGLDSQHAGILIRSKPALVHAEQQRLNKEMVAFLALAARAIKAGMRVEVFSSVEDIERAITA